MTKKAFLIILDGWGHGSDPSASAIAQARTPFVDNLYKQYPNAELITYGKEVGLPEGQMGNSEVGHLNIGAGRIVYQELARINQAIQEEQLIQNTALISTLSKAKSENKNIHLMGLVSDGGVHSHINHLKALCDITHEFGLKNVFIHAFLDGRDTDPQGGKSYIKDLLEHIDNKNVFLATIIGRYYAMDRDHRWERTKLAYDLFVNKKADACSNDPIKTIQEKYDEGLTDEFMPPLLINTNRDSKIQSIEEGDVVISFNFRTDRPRQICYVLTQEDVLDYGMSKLEISMLTMTRYDHSFKNIDVIFEKEDIINTLGQVISDNGLSQLRIAETEKYPHVTFFFSGGKEDTFANEQRILIDSPKVATYDLQPEMSAYELTNAVHKAIESQKPDFIILNYANADMVGHTGVFNAAIKAVQTLDACLESIVPIALENSYLIIIIADHGNADFMVNEDGSPNTAHTMNPVPIIIIDPENNVNEVRNGKLADLAPTIIHYMGLKIPKDMTGSILID